MFITHSHVDHLMGFPAFPPLFDSSFCGDVWLKTRGGLPARSQIEALMAPPLWPIKTDALKADIRFHDVESRFSVGEVLVETMEANHPGGSTIYKLTFGGVSVVYATDYEPLNDAPDDFCEFARDCSLLLIDAQYTSEEYLRTKGFGHSTLKRSAAIAANCGARQTIFVHHDPSRTDRQLSEWEEKLQNENPALRFGRGGEEIVL